jgi:hypothetical protein
MVRKVMNQYPQHEAIDARSQGHKNKFHLNEIEKKMIPQIEQLKFKKIGLLVASI